MSPTHRFRTIACLFVHMPVIVFLSLQTGLAEVANSEPRLYSEWPDHIELPPRGQAVLQINGQAMVFDNLTSCGVVEGGQGFIMRAGGEDEEGRYQSFRIYRRIIGQDGAMPGEDELVQLSVRDHDSIWSHALMRVRRTLHDDSITWKHGNTNDWPAVNVRYRGTGVWASGMMARQSGSSDIVPAGEFFVVANCP